MQMKLIPKLIAGLLCVLIHASAAADNGWRAKSHVELQDTGFVEAIVPPGLVSQTGRELDLSLAGPDGLPRAFELYWREPVGEIRRSLTPSQVRLDSDNHFIWEAPLPDNFTLRRLEIDIAGKNYIGKVSVAGLNQGAWSQLVVDAAVFAVNGRHRTTIDLPGGAYEKIGLRLVGLDQGIKPTLIPITSVAAVGQRQGKDFAHQRIDLAFEAYRSDERLIVEASLPGAGLWLASVTVKTEAQFQGQWQVGREIIANGRKTFEPLIKGRALHLKDQEQRLTIEVNQRWPGHALVMRLESGNRYIGGAVSLKAMVRLPRLVFVAEKPGRYTLVSHSGHSVAVRKHPGESNRATPARVQFSAPEINAQWGLVSLLEKYPLKGAPFDPGGYAWRAPLSISRPGYYRFTMSLPASLEPRRESVRIVRQGHQIPYLSGRREDQSIALTTVPVHDAGNNRSQWTLPLPQASPHWQALTFSAVGLFKRKIVIERPNLSGKGWQTWRTATWENHGRKATDLRIDLSGFPKDAQSLRAVMAHGDNPPVEISKISAHYSAPTFYFLAHTPGDYYVYGGHPDAAIPQYDLSLVQKEVLATLPTPTEMGTMERLRDPGWKSRLQTWFEDTGWGLYAILGLVTLLLLGLIVRLFPKAGALDA